MWYNLPIKPLGPGVLRVCGTDGERAGEGSSEAGEITPVVCLQRKAVRRSRGPTRAFSPVESELEASGPGPRLPRPFLQYCCHTQGGRRGRKGECVLGNRSEPCVLKITGRFAGVQVHHQNREVPRLRHKLLETPHTALPAISDFGQPQGRLRRVPFS